MTDVILTAADEYLNHQMVASFEQVGTTDRNWTEKGYIVAYDVSGEIMVTAGIGKYSNRDVMDGFAGVAVPGKQYNVRATRELRPELDRTVVGPISWEVVHAPSHNRIMLAENELGVSYDVTYESDFAPIVGAPGERRDRGSPGTTRSATSSRAAPAAPSLSRVALTGWIPTAAMPIKTDRGESGQCRESPTPTRSGSTTRRRRPRPGFVPLRGTARACCTGT